MIATGESARGSEPLAIPLETTAAEQPNEVSAGLDAQPDVRTVTRGFDQGLEWRLARVVLVPAAASERVGANRCGRALDVEPRRRSGIVTLELAELPLTREKPQRIVDARRQRLVHLAGGHRLVPEVGHRIT